MACTITPAEFNALNTKTNLKITLSWRADNLLHDIATITYAEGDITPDDAPEVKHHILDLTQEGNIDRCRSLITTAIARAGYALIPLTNDPAERCGHSLDNTVGQPDSYVIVLHVPATFPAAKSFAIERDVHEFIISSVLADWYATLLPAKAPYWQAKADRLLDDITLKSSLSLRARRPLTPF